MVVFVRMARGRLHVADSWSAASGWPQVRRPVGRRGKLGWIRVFARWPGFDPLGRLPDPGPAVVLRA